MRHRSLHARVRIPTTALAALMIMMTLLVPASFAAAPGGGGSNNPTSVPRAGAAQGATNAPSVYNLCGDCSQLGSNVTTHNSSGDDLICIWCFRGVGSGVGDVVLLGSADNAADGTGVFGTASVGTTAYGVWGLSNSGSGVVGSGVVNGVLGSANSGDGVHGYATTGHGVEGNAGNGGIALYGNNTGNGSGFYGFSSGGPGGVMGSQVTEGARFYTRNSASYALVTGGLSGTYGNAYVTGRVTATGGCCSAPQMTDGTTREMNAVESTQALFSDQGVGQLVNGKAIISIESLFAQTVDLSGDYLVFVTPRSADTYGLAVVSRKADGFMVRELNKGTGNFSFDWRIDAPQKGHAGQWMPVAPAPPASSGAVYNMPAANPLDQANRDKINKQLANGK